MEAILVNTLIGIAVVYMLYKAYSAMMGKQNSRCSCGKGSCQEQQSGFCACHKEKNV